jgi:hypothetical protein
MLRSLAFLSFLFFCMFRTSAQDLIRGNVVSAETGKPIAGVSIFISNTSRGTVTDDKGEFVLRNIPTGKYILVISNVGYQTDQEPIDSRSLKPFYNISMRVKTDDLSEVTVRAYDQEGWKRWGEFFREYFIGTSAFSKQCKIVNPEAVRIHYNKNKKILSAFSDGPILIENRALGYLLQVNLENFRMDFISQHILFNIFPLFKEMDGTPRDKKQWAANRKLAYYGSLMHFYRALFRGRVKEEGFSMHHFAHPDSTETAADPSYIIAVRDSNAMILDFKDVVKVTYLRKAVPEEYLSDYGLDPTNPEDKTLHTMTRSNVNGWTTTLELTNRAPIEVFANGSSLNTDMQFVGFWIWWQKMATLLPFDYDPSAPIP